MKTAKRCRAGIALFALLLPFSAWAQGILLPKGQVRLPRLLSNVVKIQVEENVARVTATHVFRNEDTQPVEGVFYMPLPRGATVTDLTSRINGRTLEGELLGRAEAERIYEEIVRRDLDPALLQLLDNRLLKLSIYPLQPGKEARVTVRYQMELPVERNTVELRYPLRTDIARGRSRRGPFPVFGRAPGYPAKEHKADSAAVGEARIEVSLKSEHAIGNIYSPTHELDVERPDERTARISADVSGGDGQFVLYWTLARGPMAVSVLAQRKEGEDGTFLLSVAPVLRPGGRRIPLDVAFVLDVSGSMDGTKIEQAKKALLTCLDSLSSEDRFAIVTFSDQVTAYSDSWLPASQRERARAFVADQTAEGGTDLHAALQKVLQLPENRGRFQLILLLTDGRPTAGETRLAPIVRLVEDSLGAARVFAFGIGSDVDAILLDKIAERGRGFTLYISEREIANAVESFFMRVRNPVLSDLKLDLGDRRGIYDVYPPKLPDLFYGTEMRVAGRYKLPGHRTVTLRGKLRGKEVVYRFDLDLPERDVAHPFVPRLWAARKIGYLLDQIRMNGESKELVDEVKRLSEKFGLLTPYTSYLTRDRALQAFAQPQALPARPQLSRSSGRYSALMPLMSLDKVGPAGAAASASGGVPAFRAKSVGAAAQIGALKRAEVVPRGQDVRYVAGRTFVWQDSVWVELRLIGEDQGSRKVVAVRYGSPAFFWLLRQDAETREVLSLGRRVHFLWKNVRIEVGRSGIESRQALERLLGS
ncbi:MAG: VWA domain-containing protein [Calditrichaeota bacterium]|nr:VWA domain-containing protein [Calditrichota bacterium]